MINIKIEKEVLLNLLMDRLACWGVDDNIMELFYKMYENRVDNGCFEYKEFDPVLIVDNDYTIRCKVIDKTDKFFDTIKDKFEKEGYCDISEETCYSSIKASNENKTKFLVINK